MEYRGVELPKLTPALSKKMEQVADHQGEWKFLAEVLGDSLHEFVDGDKFMDCDVALLDATFIGVRTAYEAPAREAQRASIESALEALSGLDINKLAEVSQTLNRQGFRNVR